jgi:DMSO/TMAO reductase YedYZ heme-binding membrane subunit
MPDLSPETVLTAGALLLLISLTVLTSAMVWHRRRMERWRNLDQLNSVYNSRERRIRGD